jgi:hypothetical protein
MLLILTKSYNYVYLLFLLTFTKINCVLFVNVFLLVLTKSMLEECINLVFGHVFMIVRN